LPPEILPSGQLPFRPSPATRRPCSISPRHGRLAPAGPPKLTDRFGASPACTAAHLGCSAWYRNLGCASPKRWHRPPPRLGALRRSGALVRGPLLEPPTRPRP